MLVEDDEAGVPIAFVIARAIPPLDVHIECLYVDPAWRGRCIGRALVLDLLDRAACGGHTRARVEALSGSARALAFWRGLGFDDLSVTLVRNGQVRARIGRTRACSAVV